MILEAIQTMNLGKTIGYYKWIILLIDLCLVGCSSASLLLLVFVQSNVMFDWELITRYGLPVLTFTLLTHIFFKTHLVIIRSFALVDVIRLIKSRTVHFVLVFLFSAIYNEYIQNKYNLWFYIAEMIVSLVLLLTFRIVMNWIWRVLSKEYRVKLTPAIIYGAGELGKIAFYSLDKRYDFIGFIDDDSDKQGKLLFGRPIVSLGKSKSLILKSNVKVIINAIPSLLEIKRKDILDLALTHNIQIKKIPNNFDFYDRKQNNQLKQIEIEDLLAREPIEVDNQKIGDMLFGKTILITGAAGSIGSEISKQVLKYWPSKVILFDQAETPMFNLEKILLNIEEYHNIEKQFVIGDITNEIDLLRVFKNEKIDVIYHAAAYKHVPLMEENPFQAINVNTIGSSLLGELSVKYEVERFVQISTDKAVNPTNVMGATKRAAELYIQSLQGLNKTKFITTRFGNVLGSNGSVVPFFKKQIDEGGPVTVTHPDIERYFMSIPEACNLVLEASAMSEGGEIFVFDMGKPIKIRDLADRMIRLSGLKPNQDIFISYIGLRPGEKLYEELLANSENTIPTYHDKILIAKVVNKDYRDMITAWEKLNDLVEFGTKEEVINWLHSLVPEFETQVHHLTRLNHIKEKPFDIVNLHVSPYLLSRRKRFFDLIISLFAFPFVMVILTILFFVHPFFAGFPFFYKHFRMGKDSKEFLLYKIRTLKRDNNNIRAGMGNSDGTIIPVVGKFLRKYKLDELPQIFNVIMGKMSWVGPRPEQFNVAKKFIEQDHRYASRHMILPGLTGLAQINNPQAVLDDFEEKLFYDFEYMKNASFLGDMKILFKSIIVVLRSPY